MKVQHPGRYLWLYSFVELTLIVLVALLGANSAQLENLSIDEDVVDLVWVKGKVKTQAPSPTMVVRIESGEKPYALRAGTAGPFTQADLNDATSLLKAALNPSIGKSRGTAAIIELQPGLSSASLHYFQLAGELKQLCAAPACNVQVRLDYRD
jgi:hypothetical protein